jgi:arylsulfatase
VGETALAKTYPFFMDWEGLDVGRDGLSPVTPAYRDRGEFRFTGALERVTIELGATSEGADDYEPAD